MDRKNNLRDGIVGIFSATILLLAATQCCGVVTNGFFDSSQQLSGWSYNDAGGVTWSAVNLSNDGTGSALLQQSGLLPSSQLWQRFLVDNGSDFLTFTIRTPQPGSHETDYLYIGLFDDSNTSLMGDPLGFFEWNSDSGEYLYPTDPEITYSWEIINDDENIEISWVIYNFIVPVTSLNNDYVTLRFQLNHDLEDTLSTAVWVDNLALHGTPINPPVVPVPTALGLVFAGLTSLAFFARKRP